MNKKLYVLPNTTIATISTNDMLVVFGSSQPRRKDFGSSTRCPFNGLWCAEKQDHLDKWRDTVKSYSEQGKDYKFYTRGDMFDGCPWNHTALCSQHEQKQRG
jgi:hypothetical protein